MSATREYTTQYRQAHPERVRIWADRWNDKRRDGYVPVTKPCERCGDDLQPGQGALRSCPACKALPKPLVERKCKHCGKSLGIFLTRQAMTCPECKRERHKAYQRQWNAANPARAKEIQRRADTRHYAKIKAVRAAARVA
jgi:hypothetical protein